MSDDRLVRKQRRALRVIGVASMLMGIPSLVYTAQVLWYSETFRWVCGGIFLVIFALVVIAHYSEDKYDRMWREVGEELERDRKPE